MNPAIVFLTRFLTRAFVVYCWVLVICYAGHAQILDAPVVRAQMGKMYSQAIPTFVWRENSVEFSFTVRTSGVSPILSSNERMQNTLPLYGDEIAIIHTHPLASTAKPSDGDVHVAISHGIPNYVLSRTELWVALPDGTIRKLADVSWKHGLLLGML